jgi:hypothetical protein
MSPWYAVSSLSDARDATEALLWPFDRGTWLRLALIALFVGVGGGLPTGGSNAGVPSGGGGGTPSDVPTPGLPSDGTIFAIVAAVIVVLLVLFLLWNVVGAVMEFVLVVGLRDREVRVREPFRANLRRGLRLFGFRLAVGLGSLLLVGLPVVAVIGLGIGLSPFLLLLLIPLIVVFGVVALVGSVVLGLTTDFVVPTMLTEDRGVLDAWRRLWPTLREEWKQTAVYVVAKFVLGIAVGLAVSIVVLLAALVVAIPFAIVGGGLYLALSAAGVGGVALVLVGLFAVLFALVLFLVALLIQVPALAFVRYYSLSVLGRFDADLDLVGIDRSDDEDGDGGDAGEHSTAEGDAGPAEAAGEDVTADDDSPPSTDYRSCSWSRSVVSISGWRA